MEETKEQKTMMHISLVGTPEELIRLKNIIVAARDKAEIVMMNEALKEETHPDSQEEKKEEKPEFIDGEVYTYTSGDCTLQKIFIAKGEPRPGSVYAHKTEISSYLAIYIGNDILHPIEMYPDDIEVCFCIEACRPATREEADLLRKVLYEHDLVWDAEKQQVVKREAVQGWKPIDGQPCWICYHFSREREFLPILVEDGEAYHEEIKRGWAFPTKQDCQRMCDKLNAAILQTSINEQTGL